MDDLGDLIDGAAIEPCWRASSRLMWARTLSSRNERLSRATFLSIPLSILALIAIPVVLFIRGRPQVVMAVPGLDPGIDPAIHENTVTSNLSV
jgi:hypothetical protein